MNIKPMQWLGALLILVGICAVTLFFVTRPEKVPVRKYVATSQGESDATETSETPKEQTDAVPQDDTKRAKDWHLSKLHLIGPDENDAYRAAYKKAIESPAFAEYRRKQDALSPGYNLGLWWDFLESQGLSSGRTAQEKRFREHFPTGEYVDYEPMMRQRLAERFLEAGLLPVQGDDDESAIETISVMQQFRLATDENRVWMRGYFNGYDGDLAWAKDIRQNAASIVAEATSEPLDAAQPATEPKFIAEPIPTDENLLESQPQPPLSNEEAPVPEALEPMSQSREGIEAELLRTFSLKGEEVDANIETSLREQFSYERLNRAMQTLNQYGTQEGLRRLKETDPELAARVERRLPKKPEDN